MRFLKLMVGLAAILVLFVGFEAQSVKAQNVDDFKIVSFEADYHLERTADKISTYAVTEKIIAEFPSVNQNHGILRVIPKTYQDHTLSLKVSSVTDGNNQPINYSSYSQNDNLVLKIGDADRYVHGQKIYVISYQMRNVTVNFSDHDELYWDVNGDQWAQTFERVTARIHIPTDLAANLQDQQVCYAGLSGQNYQDSCVIERNRSDNEMLITTATTRALNPYETLTFTIAFNSGTFLPGPEIAREQLIRKIKLAAYALAIVLPPAAAAMLMFRRWRAFGDDPKGRGVIVPEYQPPKNFTCLTSDFLLQQKLRGNAFSAGLVELAVKRYLTIYEIPKKGLFGKADYELELNKLPVDLPEELKKTIETVFLFPEPGARLKLSEIKKSSTKTRRIFEAMQKLESWLSADLHRRKYFIKDPRKVKRGYLIWASVVLAVGMAGVFIIPIAALGIGLILASLVMFGFARIMPARTATGVQAHDALLGLKDYIKLAEADRLKFGQSPEGAEKITQGSFDPNNPKAKVKLFESLLPFAMLFGLEKQWAKQFEGIYENPPDWYHGNWAAFNTGYLASSLHGLNSASSTTFTAPSSSSGSGFSGGSSGGGGGGGGGGGW